MNTTELKPLLHQVSGTGEPIVLLPGGLSGWLSWVPFVEPLARERQVVRVQLRSVELAEAGLPYPPDYNSLDELEALRKTVDLLALDRFDLVGWSYGGHIALAFALEYSWRVRTLTLIEPAAFWILREMGYDQDDLGMAEAQLRSLAGKAVTVDDLKAFLVLAGLGSPDQQFESLPSWPVWVRNRQVLSGLGTIWDYSDSLERLRALDMPVLAVKGSETDALDAAIVDRLLSVVPHGRLLELPGGHASHLQNQERFLSELKHQLTGVPA